jgi:hypothetical protein
MRAFLAEPGPTLMEFLTAWHGPPDRPGTRHDRHRDAPAPLIEWFDVTTRWTEPVTVQNDFVDLEKLEVEAGLVTFWVENQGVWEWAYQVGEPDPFVFDREAEDDAAWSPTGYRLTTFLVRIAMFEAVMGAEHGASAPLVQRDQRDAILAPLEAVPGPAWNWPHSGGSRFYAGDGVLALAGPDTSNHSSVESAPWGIFIASQDPTKLAYLADLTDIEWV